jgi:DNA-binding FrmR family transcriptional regulator
MQIKALEARLAKVENAHERVIGSVDGLHKMVDEVQVSVRVLKTQHRESRA